jgi:hypothetical protein
MTSVGTRAASAAFSWLHYNVDGVQVVASVSFSNERAPPAKQ